MIYSSAMGPHNPRSEGGHRLLAHELTHVIQQRGGIRSSWKVNNPISDSDQAKVLQRGGGKGKGSHTISSHNAPAIVRDALREICDNPLIHHVS